MCKNYRNMADDEGKKKKMEENLKKFDEIVDEVHGESKKKKKKKKNKHKHDSKDESHDETNERKRSVDNVRQISDHKLSDHNPLGSIKIMCHYYLNPLLIQPITLVCPFKGHLNVSIPELN